MSDLEQAAEALSSTAPVGTGQTSVGGSDAGVAEEKPFFSWKADDGEERVFKKPAELADFLRHSGMRKKDYDAALGKLTERGKYLDELERKYQTESVTAQEMAQKWKPIDELMVKNPEFSKEVKAAYERMVKGRQSDPSTVVEQMLQEKLKPYEEKFSELERDKQERAARERREAAIERLKGKYEDLDPGIFDQEFKRLEEIPEEARDEALLELIYHSVRGRETPAAIERKMAQSAGGRPSVRSTPGSKSAGIDATKLSPAERREAAARELAALGVGEEE